MENEPLNRIAELRHAKGWTQDRLAKACDPPTTQPQIRRLEAGKRKLTQEWMMTLSKALDVQPSELLPRKAQPVADRNVPVNAGPELLSHVVPESGSYVGKRDLPLRTYAQGGSGAQFFETPVGMVYRPEELLNVRDGYAIEIWDTSMEPALRHGRKAYVNPHKQVQPEDEVVIQLKDGRVLVKELVRRKGGRVYLKQHNPKKEIDFSESEIVFMHLILSSQRVRT